MARTNIPLITPFKERRRILDKDGVLENVYLESYTDHTLYVVKRPAFDYLHSPHATYTGYGMFHMIEANSGIWCKWDGAAWDLYKTDLGVAAGTFVANIPNSALATHVYWTFQKAARSSTGNSRIVFGNLGTQGWVHENGGSTTEITDADFPGSSKGFAYVDGYTFAADGDSIFNSSLDDPLTWAATDFISPSLAPDGIQWIATHQNHVVSFGQSSIEFFRNAGNPTGSVLRPRRDVTYNGIGLYRHKGTSSTANYPYSGIADIDYGNSIAFISQSQEGKLGIHLLENFGLRKLSDVTIDKYLNFKGATNDFNPALSSFCINGETFLIFTTRYGGNPATTQSFVYDFKHNLWSRWKADSNISIRGACEIISSATVRVSSGTAIAPPGSLVMMEDGKIYLMREDIFQDVDSGAASRTITVEINTDKYRGPQGTETLTKYMPELYLIGDRAASANNVQVEFTDDDYQTYTSMGNLDISSADNKLTQLSSFQERAFRLTHTANAALRLEALQAEVSVGKD